ncbi:MAG: LytTR family DNA-binding domain-containing protein [Clostridium sp.]|nr:LytTR family DNA-binding domain-containing protein [Clostridium sp.]
MRVLRIAICDDEEANRIYIRKLIERQETECNIMEFSSGKDLLHYQDAAVNFEIDILFLDIAMKDMDGIAVAKTLRENMEHQQKAVWGSLPLLIFVTGSREYMQSAFSVHAFQYIVKPIQEPEFQRIFTQALREYQYLTGGGQPEAKEILVKNKNQVRKVLADDVFYIESSNRKVILCLQDEKIEFYDKISNLEQKLQPDFFRIHKGYLINLKYVAHYSRTEVQMKNGDSLLVSKYKYHDFVNAYLQYISEER